MVQITYTQATLKWFWFVWSL